MYYRSPKLADELIMDAARRPGTPSLATNIIAMNSAQQLKDTADTESMEKNIALGERRLAESGRQFNANLGLAKKQFDYEKGQGGIATALSGLGLGASILGNNAASQRHQQRMAIRNSMISDLENAGDERSLFFAKLLKYQE